MNTERWRAVVVDFDRTLLRTDKTVSAYTVRVLRELRREGIRLFAATARPERAITAYCETIAFDAVTTLNGARTVIRDTVVECPIAARSAETVLDRLERAVGTVISVETEHGLFANTDIPEWMPKVTDRIRELPRKEKIYKILASHPDMPPEGISVALPEDTYISVADRKLLQVMSREATKWNGVRRMLEAYRIDAAQAVCFGDDNDDIEPIRRCGCGVAVGNALDCVKEIADYVTESNDADGVAAFLSAHAAEFTGGGCTPRGCPSGVDLHP